jgi:hypothetical protein
MASLGKPGISVMFNQVHSGVPLVLPKAVPYTLACIVGWVQGNGTRNINHSINQSIASELDMHMHRAQSINQSINGFSAVNACNESSHVKQSSMHAGHDTLCISCQIPVDLKA